MKKILMFMAVAFALSFNMQAQKIGHLNVQEVMTQMPEYKTASDQLTAFRTEYEKQIEGLRKELETKYNDYTTNAKTMTPAVQEVKQKELGELDNRLQQKTYEAQGEVEKKQNALLTPILEKVSNAIKAVATEGNYDYILETSQIHFGKDANNVSSLVKAKLGIK